MARMSTGYRFHQVISNGSSNIETDSDPNSVTPPENRIASLPLIPPHAANGFVFHLIDGTDIDVQIWVKEETTETWVKAATAAKTVTASPTVATLTGFALTQGTKVFMQVTENAGNTKQLGWRYC